MAHRRVWVHLPIRPESPHWVLVDVQGYVLNADGHLAHMVNRHSPELQQGSWNGPRR
ncbi:MAG: hypothetical protein Ct9H300mP1_20140 [Planctomycetaceae bacterium]|nr:MAG: hypothetical protein Ct9H300mP1_20140 [Planctomycetaceae bacterium]